jgi:hypothetical protein
MKNTKNGKNTKKALRSDGSTYDQPPGPGESWSDAKVTSYFMTRESRYMLTCIGQILAKTAKGGGTKIRKSSIIRGLISKEAKRLGIDLPKQPRRK